MAGPKTYIGVSSKARQVSDIYIGVSSKARKVTKVYAGVSGKARLVFSADFWTAGGVAAANCLAAYRFKGAASEIAALKKVNSGTAYNLTKVGEEATWTSAKGFHIPAYGGLNNATLLKKDILSIVARFSGATTSTNYASVVSGGFSYRALFLRTPYATQSFARRYTDALGGQYADTQYTGSTMKSIRSSTDTSTSGVVGITFSDTGITLYKDGTKLSVSVPSFTDTNGTVYNTSAGPHSGRYKLIGMDAKQEIPETGTTYDYPEKWRWAGYYIQAIAFYNVALTAAQHKAVADAMLAL